MALNKKEQLIGAIVSFWAIVLFLSYLVLPVAGFDNAMLPLLFGLILIAAMCVCIFIFRKFRKENKPLIIDYLNLGVQRYILGLFMIFYGVPKLLGNFFDYQLFALDSKLGDISEFELAWYYFGKNNWQELFSGIMEFVPGILLLNRRTYYIASLILLPVTAQVFLLNLFFKIGGITFPAAAILLACNIYIIYSQREKIILFFKSLDFSAGGLPDSKTFPFIRLLRWLGILLGAFVIFINVRKAFFKPRHQARYNELVGVYTLQEMKKNNIPYTPTTDSVYYKDLYIEKQERWNILRRFNGETDAFVIGLNNQNDSISIYINRSGTGDGTAEMDTSTVLKGVYTLKNDLLTVKGFQMKDTVELKYRKQALKPKGWLW